MSAVMKAVIPASAAPQGVSAVILPGWMPREQAVNFLTKECLEPQFNEATAGQTWKDYRAKVEEMAPREAMAPARLPFSAAEQAEVDAFLSWVRQMKFANIKDVVKINPLRCIAWQLQIITDRSVSYCKSMMTEREAVRHCLARDTASPQLPLTITPNDVRARLPHAEFMFNYLNPGGFQIQQQARHVSVSSYDQRLVLWAGYHRSFALMTKENPEGTDRSLVAALTTDADFMLSESSPNHGVREMLRGLRPPLMADFLDERFCMKVRLRKKRCELWIQARVMWLDEES